MCSMPQQSSVVIAAVLLANIIIQQRSATVYAAQVLVSPKTILALVDPNKTAQFTCEAKGVGVDWFLSGTHDGQENGTKGVTSNTTLHVNASESGAAVFSSHLWVPRAEEFDNMSIVCRARGGNASESQDSDVAWLKLEAPLVAPYNFQLNATQTTISILWNCTVAEHTEILYNITVLKMDGNTMVIQTQEAELSFGLDHPFAELCTNYTFSVVAWSVLDTSDPSEPVTLGFHCPVPTEATPIALAGSSSVVTNTPVIPIASEMCVSVPELQVPSFSLVFVISVTVPMAIVILVLIAMVATLMLHVYYIHKRKSKSKGSGGRSDVPVVMRGNDAYQTVKISRTGRDGVDMDQCPAYGVVGNSSNCLNTQ